MHIAAFGHIRPEDNRAPLLRGSRDPRTERLRFISHFDSAKARVSEMQVRFILLDGPIERTLFEVYAALALDTLVYNSFETH